MPKKQEVRVEKKIKIIRDYDKSRISMSEVARRDGVAWETMRCWARNYEAKGADAFLSRKKTCIQP